MLLCFRTQSKISALAFWNFRITISGNAGFINMVVSSRWYGTRLSWIAIILRFSNICHTFKRWKPNHSDTRHGQKGLKYEQNLLRIIWIKNQPMRAPWTERFKMWKMCGWYNFFTIFFPESVPKNKIRFKYTGLKILSWPEKLTLVQPKLWPSYNENKIIVIDIRPKEG